MSEAYYTEEELGELAAAIRKTLIDQKASKIERGFYWETQIAMAYNSERIEGCLLTEDQTRSIFETGTVSGEAIRVDDVDEMRNHFRMFDLMLDTLDEPLTKGLVKRFLGMLQGGSAERPGEWKTIPNAVGGAVTAAPEEVETAMDRLLEAYNSHDPTLENIVAFHVRFEMIRPLQDGNGRVGRMVMFRECLRAGIPPFVILDSQKDDYYRGLQEFRQLNRGPLEAFCRRMTDLYLEEFAALVPRHLLLPSTGDKAMSRPAPTAEESIGFADHPGRPAPAEERLGLLALFKQIRHRREGQGADGSRGPSIKGGR